MSDLIQFNVVILAHNELDCIGPATDSVLAHSHQLKEVVIVDNGYTVSLGG